MNKSSYLQPQLEINDPLNEIKKKPFFTSQEDTFYSELKASIPDGWDEFIHSFKKNEITISETQLQKIKKAASYNWTFEGDHITIVINTDSSQLSESDFEISTTSIRSKIISGKFLYPIKSHSIVKDTENNLNLILKLDTENNECNSNDDWPVLISDGDDVDSFSSFLLADSSMRLNEIDFFFYWGIKSATKGCALAQKSLGIMYLTLKDFDKAMFWFTKLSLNNQDDFGRIVLAQFLFESQDGNCDPRLAENILISLAKEDTKEAFYYLGYLHLQKMENWNNDEKLAVKYLEEAAKKGDNPSLQLLAECYSNGIGCEKNEEKALFYTKLANDTQLINDNFNLPNENNDNNNKQIQINDNENSDDQGFPIASILVSAAAIVGTALMGRYVFRRIFRK